MVYEPTMYDEEQLKRLLEARRQPKRVYMEGTDMIAIDNISIGDAIVVVTKPEIEEENK